MLLSSPIIYSTLATLKSCRATCIILLKLKRNVVLREHLLNTLSSSWSTSHRVESRSSEDRSWLRCHSWLQRRTTSVSAVDTAGRTVWWLTRTHKAENRESLPQGKRAALVTFLANQWARHRGGARWTWMDCWFNLLWNKMWYRHPQTDTHLLSQLGKNNEHALQELWR